jgi:hypothetical protein
MYVDYPKDFVQLARRLLYKTTFDTRPLIILTVRHYLISITLNLIVSGAPHRLARDLKHNRTLKSLCATKITKFITRENLHLLKGELPTQIIEYLIQEYPYVCEKPYNRATATLPVILLARDLLGSPCRLYCDLPPRGLPHIVSSEVDFIFWSYLCFSAPNHLNYLLALERYFREDPIAKIPIYSVLHVLHVLSSTATGASLTCERCCAAKLYCGTVRDYCSPFPFPTHLSTARKYPIPVGRIRRHLINTDPSQSESPPGRPITIFELVESRLRDKPFFTAISSYYFSSLYAVLEHNRRDPEEIYRVLGCTCGDLESHLHRLTQGGGAIEY